MAKTKEPDELEPVLNMVMAVRSKLDRAEKLQNLLDRLEYFEEDSRFRGFPLDEELQEQMHCLRRIIPDFVHQSVKKVERIYTAIIAIRSNKSRDEALKQTDEEARDVATQSNYVN
jgi:hypothetical protein